MKDLVFPIFRPFFFQETIQLAKLNIYSSVLLGPGLGDTFYVGIETVMVCLLADSPERDRNFLIPAGIVNLLIQKGLYHISHYQIFKLGQIILKTNINYALVVLKS